MLVASVTFTTLYERAIAPSLRFTIITFNQLGPIEVNSRHRSRLEKPRRLSHSSQTQGPVGVVPSSVSRLFLRRNAKVDLRFFETSTK